MPNWTLDNAVEIQKESPYTFYWPSDEIIDRLKPNEATVKLIFRFESDDPDIMPNGERMWVILNDLDENGNYTGTLDNEPVYIKDLKEGDKITFRREHIIQYDTLDDLNVEDPLSDKIDQYFQRCFVSNQIMKDGLKVGRLYKEDPAEMDDPDYSGWTFMSDFEDDEYINNPDNLQYLAIGVVLNQDDSFIHLLESPIGAEFALDQVAGTYCKID